jgi:hypothetical protein
MRGKLALVVGLATGYVLGTRDGRARYEQLKSQATRVMQDPRVREKAAQAGDLAKEKAPLVRDKVADVASQAGSKVGSGSGSGNGSGSDSGTRYDSGPGSRAGSGPGSDSDLPAQTSATGPDLTQSTAGPSEPSPATQAEDVADEDAILLTPPSPSPLAPGPTQSSSSNGGQDG